MSANSQKSYLHVPEECKQAMFALEAAVWIMVALAEGAKHGYAIMKDIEGLGGFSMPPGTLYAALARMERAGLVREIQNSDYRRRPFKLTPAGAIRLTEDMQVLSSLASTGLRRIKQRNRTK
jgi:DNA-binding PadR family transcriptional regulator